MTTRIPWLKIIILLLIGIVIATVIRISGLIFLSDALSYILSFLVMAVFAYLAIAASFPNLRKFITEHRAITSVVGADFIIRTMAIVIFFPDFLPSISNDYSETNPLVSLLVRTSGFFLGVSIEFAVAVLLYYFSYKICAERNRNPLKGVVATFIGFPFTPLILWLALKTRDPKTRQLY